MAAETTKIIALVVVDGGLFEVKMFFDEIVAPPARTNTTITKSSKRNRIGQQKCVCEFERGPLDLPGRGEIGEGRGFFARRCWSG